MNPHLPGAGSLQQDMQPFALQPQHERAGTLWIGVSPIIHGFSGAQLLINPACSIAEKMIKALTVVLFCRICLTLLMRLSSTDCLSVSLSTKEHCQGK